MLSSDCLRMLTKSLWFTLCAAKKQISMCCCSMDNNLIYVLVVGKRLRQALLFTFPCIVAWTINNLVYVLVVGKGLRQALPFTFPRIVVA